MLWALHHEWTSGARFSFNYYRQWATIVIRKRYGMGHFLHSKEGVTQEFPLDMIAYSLGILLLIRNLRACHPIITQNWHADDSGAGGNFAGIRQHLDDLIVRAPPQGYLPESNKRILVVSLRNVLREEAFFRG